jgi:hypothetical protein
MDLPYLPIPREYPDLVFQENENPDVIIGHDCEKCPDCPGCPDQYEDYLT